MLTLIESKKDDPWNLQMTNTLTREELITAGHRPCKVCNP